MSKFPFTDFRSETFSVPREGITLEYKTAEFSLPKAFWETYSAFANTDGGVIFLGIAEDKSKGQYNITGVSNPNDVIKTLWNELANKQIVNHNILHSDDVFRLKVFKKDIIEIRVPKASYDLRPIYYKNRDNTYVRTDDGDRIATPEQFKYMVVDSQEQIDTELLNNYDMDDINEETVKEYKQLYAKNKNDPSVLTQDNYQFLIDKGVFRRDRSTSDKTYKLTAGGLLFFGKLNAIINRFPGFQVDYVKKKNVSSVDWIDRVSTGDMNFEDLNLFSFYQIVEKKIANGIPDKYQQDENQTRGSYFSDMKESVKEAVVNSLMHAYYDADFPVKITDYDDYFEFFNPGEMRVTKEEFLRGSVSRVRNSVIATLFRRVGIAEREAKGGRTIAETAINHHLKSPEITTKADSTKIVLWKTDLQSSLHGLNSLEKAITEFAIEHPAFSIPEMAKEMKKKSAYKDFSTYKFRSATNSLTDKQILVFFGNGKARKYYLKTGTSAADLSRIKLIKFLENMPH
ncbi:RNA-binding domain-containing protein [Secundilactobacillus mixtipabuli]|uniref:RNA-binding domain-containing protein n=1 Tax=Secundilactobacillus mixtipabuli TaxID=1435342 RepID=UPI00135656B5|nr:RNA-binding domain-containing protein [Secundilactobacillus mixtipabuli]